MRMGTPDVDGGVRAASAPCGWTNRTATASSSIGSRTTSPSIARISRTRCSRARRSSTTRSGGAPTTSSSTTRWPTRLGVAIPPTVLLPHKHHPPGTTERSMRNLQYPLDWDKVFDYVGLPGVPEAVRRRRLEGRLQGRLAAGVVRRVRQHRRQVHDAAARGELPRVLPLLRRRPGPGAHHALRSARAVPRAVRPDAAAVRRRRCSRASNAMPSRCASALGYDLNTVEFAVEDGVPYAIDFMNPAPDADVHSVGEANFEWIVDAMAELAVRKALEPPARGAHIRWDALLNPAVPPPAAHDAADLHARDRGGIPDDRSRHVRSPLAHPDGDRREGQAPDERAREGRDAPVGHRGRHRRVPHRRRGVRRPQGPAPADDRAHRGERPAAGRRRDASRSPTGATRTSIPDERYLPGRRRHADRRPRQPDLRPARARRHRRPRDADSPDESDAVFPAAPARALDQLAVLDRHEHRLQVVPLQGVRPVPAHEHPGRRSSSWADFESFVNLLVRTRCIDNAKKIWWDVRPHPFFGTLEFRICDIPMRVDETIALAALDPGHRRRSCTACTRATRAGGSTAARCSWRTSGARSRYGIDGQLIDFGREREVAGARADRSNTSSSSTTCWTSWAAGRRSTTSTGFSTNGTGADRQLRAFQESGGDLKAVVKFMIEETKAGL